MKKKIPTLTTDREAEDFIDTADLTKYDLSGAQLMRFELKPKARAISLRLPEELYAALRDEADRTGIPYQRFIRMALEQVLHTKASTTHA